MMRGRISGWMWTGAGLALGLLVLLSIGAVSTGPSVGSISTPLFRAKNVLGRYEASLVLNGTNTVAGWVVNKSLNITNGQGVIHSTNGAFSALPQTTAGAGGYTVEFKGVSEQILITEIIDANTAIGGELAGNALVLYGQTIEPTTNWVIRPVVLRTTDDTVGAENYGLRIDASGGVWQFCSSAQQAQYYCGGLAGQHTISFGTLGAGNVGLQSFEAQGFAINAFRTNSAKTALFYVSPNAGAESVVIDNNGYLAIQYGINNRHGTFVDVFSSLQVETNLTVVTGVISGNGSGITNANGWKTMTVVSADATTTGQALVDVTGLTNILAVNSVYRFKATLLCSTTAVTTGTEYGIANTGATAGVGMTCFYTASGFTNAAGTGPGASYTIGTTNGVTPAFLQGSGQTGVVTLEGFVTTAGGPPTVAVRHLKVTSGTSTVLQGSTLEMLKVK